MVTVDDGPAMTTSKLDGCPFPADAESGTATSVVIVVGTPPTSDVYVVVADETGPKPFAALFEAAVPVGITVVTVESGPSTTTEYPSAGLGVAVGMTVVTVESGPSTTTV